MHPTKADPLIQISSGMTLTYKNMNGQGRRKILIKTNKQTNDPSTLIHEELFPFAL